VARLRELKKNDLFGGGGKGPSAGEVSAAALKEAEESLDMIEKDIDKLRAVYELYFMGVERNEPRQQRDNLRGRLRKLREFKTNNTSFKFRMQTTAARMISLENYWGRVQREREAGTYFRDRAKVKAREQELEVKRLREEAERLEKERAELEARAKERRAAQSAAADPRARRPAATSPGAPAPSEGAAVASAALGHATPGDVTARRVPASAAAPRGASVGRPRASSVDDLTEPKLRQLYSAYSTAKRRCGERVDLRFEDMAASLKKQVPKLLQSTGAKSVEFKVVIKQGRAVLKAVPKNE
jgi:hypothetical protein